MNVIHVKKFIDDTEITLEQLSQQTTIPVSTLTTMYYDELFDETKVDVNQLTLLMQILGITNINDLLPSIK